MATKLNVNDRIMLTTTTPGHKAFFDADIVIGDAGLITSINIKRNEYHICLDHLRDDAAYCTQYVKMEDIAHITPENEWRVKAAEIYRKSNPPIWVKERFWREHKAIYQDHYVHQSVRDPSLLAYFQTEEKAKRGIATQIKPGRYLMQFFSHILTEKEAAMFAAWQVKGTKETIYSKAELKFASTPEEIVDVYAKGPNSCMKGCKSVSVYGAGDLAVAYLEMEGKIKARVLCWPEKKVYSRVYPSHENWERDGFLSIEDSRDCSAAIETMLRNQGFSYDHGSDKTLDGAKLIKDKRGTTFSMPYIDHSYYVDDAKTHWIINTNGRFRCQNTNGFLHENIKSCQLCDEISPSSELRTVVTEYRNGRPSVGQSWCQPCLKEHAFHCDYSNYWTAKEIGQITVGDRTCSLAWAQGHNFYVSDYSGLWFDPNQNIGNRVVMNDGTIWSLSEFVKHGFVCAINNRNYPQTEQNPNHPGYHNSLSDDLIQAHKKKMEKKKIAAEKRAATLKAKREKERERYQEMQNAYSTLATPTYYRGTPQAVAEAITTSNLTTRYIQEIATALTHITTTEE